MASFDGEIIKRLLGKGIIGQVIDDQPVAIRLQANSGVVVTSVTVTTATDITFVTNSGTKAFLFATYTTIGALADAINAYGEFSAKILDALREDATVSKIVTGAIALNSATGYYDALVDTSTNKTLSVKIAFDRGIDGNKRLASHRVEIEEIAYTVTLGGTGAVTVVEVDAQTAKTGATLYTKPSVGTTAQTINWAAGRGKITSDWGTDLLVRITDSTSITTAVGLTVAANAY